MNPATPLSADGRLNFADSLCAQGRPLDAAQVLFEGVRIHAGDLRIRHALAGVLDGIPLNSAGPAVREVLLDLCRDESIATQSLADAVIGLTRASRAFPLLLDASMAQADLIAERAAALTEFAGDPLLTALLARALINDPDLERVLTQLRRCMLMRADAGDAVPFAFACALARQCFNTEYAFYVAQDESAPLHNLRHRIAALLRDAGVAPPALERLVVLAAMYGPLSELPGWEQMLNWQPEKMSDGFRPIWLDQVVHYRQERAIAARIEALTPITNDVSRAVRGHYEESPYPRWFTLHRPPPQSQTNVRSILIAGCGTGQHPIHSALAHPDCEIAAIDLSRASLAYAVRMAEHFEVKNLSFFQADILELGLWDRKFERIESLGVLHHLEDPLAGWRVLTGLLRKGGTMRIGLYSSIARKPLRAAQDFAIQSGFPGTPEGIRNCRRAILALPDNHPARSVLDSDDFHSASGFRDLVMHIQERTFTLPQIANCLRKLDLQFLGLQCGPEVMAGFRAAHPAPAALADLSLWHQFEQRHPDIFRGMYHFTCRRRS